MKYRLLGKTNYRVSTVSFGAWAIGGSWGETDDDQSMLALVKAVDLGVNFIDTADVYGDGRSEKLIAKLTKQRKEKVMVATKIGRRLDPHLAASYTRQNLTHFVERSLKNLDTESLDLVQLHCPPTEVYSMPEVFEVMDSLVKDGKVKFYGVSIEKVDEGIKAMEYPGVSTIQVIYNIFRQRPAETLLTLAKQRNVGVIARVPLASGLLTGKMSADTQFASDDHRQFNRDGEAFDQGETFSGVDYETGLQAVEEIRPLLPEGVSMAQFALRWILMNDAVTCAIPGAKRQDQVQDNVAASDLPALTEEQMRCCEEIYQANIAPQVKDSW